MYPDTQTMENPELDPHKKYPPCQSHNFKTRFKRKIGTVIKTQNEDLKSWGVQTGSLGIPLTALAEVAKDFRTLCHGAFRRIMKLDLTKSVKNFSVLSSIRERFCSPQPGKGTHHFKLGLQAATECYK